jgi:hypothetical protein
MQAALNTAGQPVKHGTMAHEHDVYALLTEAAVQRRDLPALQQYIPKLEELAQRDSHRLYLPIAQRAWGVVHRLTGDYAAAAAPLERALQRFGEMETGWQVGRTLFEIAELDIARSDQQAARAHFSQALAAFEALKAVPDTERTRAALREFA